MYSTSNDSLQDDFPDPLLLAVLQESALRQKLFTTIPMVPAEINILCKFFLQFDSDAMADLHLGQMKVVSHLEEARNKIF